MKIKILTGLAFVALVVACQTGKAAEKLISGVPNYDQDIFPIDQAYSSTERGDCVPAACTMLHGYHDANGWPRLIPYGGNNVSQNAWGIDTAVRKYKVELNYTGGGVSGEYFSRWTWLLGLALGNKITAVINYFEPNAAFTREDDDLTNWSRIQTYLNANRPCILAVSPGLVYDPEYKWEGSSTINEIPGGHAVCAVGWSDVGGRWVMCNMGWNYTDRAWFNYDGGGDWYISQITPGGSSSGEDDDAYEDNDTVGTARQISTGTITNLRCFDTLLAGSNYKGSWGDWYKVTATSGQSLAITTSFSHANGNLDLRVFTSSQVEVGSSTSSANSEIVSIPSTTAGSYYVFVYGLNNAKNQNYSLTVSLTSGPTIPTVQTLSAADVTTTSARLRGQVTSTGGASTLERRFEWTKSSGNWGAGTSGVDYGVVQDASVTGSDSEFSAVLSGLSPGTGYRYRVYARNSAGWSDVNLVNVATFTTSASQTRVISLSGNLAFGDVAVGSSSQRTLTIVNSGNSTLTVNSISFPSGFTGNWSSGTISSGGSQNVTVTFSPSFATSYGGTVTVNSDKTSGGNTISASGTGTTTPTRSISLSGNLAFGDVTVGSSSQRTMTIANNGNSTLTISSISFSSGFSGNWTFGTISSGDSQNVTITFSPSSATGYGGTVTVNSDKTSGVNTIAASGTGTSTQVTRVISVSGNLSFGNMAVGSSAQRTFTIANSGNATLTVSSINYPSGFSGNWSSGTISPSGSQNVAVTFSPTAEISYGGNLTVNSDSTSGSGTIAAAGIGGGGTNPNLPYEAKWALPLNTFRVYASAPAQSGGVVLFGTFSETIIAGGQSLTANGSPSDYYGVKLNASHEVVWVRQFSSPNEEEVYSCAQHPAGGWVIAGHFRDSTTIGGVALTSAGNRDAFLARLDEDGNVLWAKRGGGTGIDYGKFAGVDGAGNCFLLGLFTTSATFTGGGVTLNATGTRFDIFVAKYSSAGDFLWAKSGGGPEYDDLNYAKVDTNGNAYIGGIFEKQATYGPYTLNVVGAPTDWDGFLAKFASNGDVLWAKRFGQSTGDTSTDAINFVVPAGNGACFFGGIYEKAMLVDGQALPGNFSWTTFVGKINSGGTVEWLRAIRPEAIPEIGVYFASARADRGLAMSDGGLIVSGIYRGKLTFGSTVVTNTNNSDYQYLGKFDSAGTAQWATPSDSLGLYYVDSLFPASGDRIRMLGRASQDPVSFPGIVPINATVEDAVLIEFGPPDIIVPPVISMSMAGEKIVLTWPATAPGFILEWATNLPPTGWTSNSAMPSLVGETFAITNQISGGMKYFRLKK